MAGEKDLSELAKALPLVQAYEDLLQPAARELGKGLEVVAKTITAALLPLRAAVWGMDRIEGWLIPSLSERLADVPSEQVISPSPLVAGPAIEALRFAASDETLREMYANLLAAAMDVATATSAHPSFVEILKQLSPEEALILSLFADRDAYPLVRVTRMEGPGGVTALRYFGNFAGDISEKSPELFAAYIDNLARLGLVEVPPLTSLVAEGIYDQIEAHPLVAGLVKHLTAGAARGETERILIRRTALGLQFIEVCVRDRRKAK